ncbi:nitrilase-related carbon-nitrogen hydrolase [Tomitella fengzijianii]|uniref:Hydrolase n=1 Tax=Tomitella fengzijianii TaxID=2597660 RepID=A0A516X6L6_9ACTN|nr:nitrilase-related carbon-nitrogen hydrolase [Tomitella fengzijianii]QDQ98718.1 hydrolase [Tomitella fengzijianii]
MRVALLQGPESTDIDGALAEVAASARSAAESGAVILVCSELTCTGFRRPLRPEPGPGGTAPGPIARTMAQAARETGIAIAYGYVEQGRVGKRGGGKDLPLYNAVAVVGADGELLAHYRKTHLYVPREDDTSPAAGGGPDDAAFTPGDDPVVQFALGGLTCGILICYDVEFPEAVRAHALAGTDWLLVPTALAYPDDHVARILVPARAVESQLFISYVNRIGQEPGAFEGSPVTYYCGHTCAVAPDSTEFARAGDEAELLVVDLDPELLARSRRRNTYLRDRRTDLYGASGSGTEGGETAGEGAGPRSAAGPA